MSRRLVGDVATAAAAATRVASVVLRSAVCLTVAASCGISLSGCGSTHRSASASAARKPVVHRVAVGGAPVGLLAYGGSLWVADAGTDQVMRLDERTGAVTARVHVGHIPL